MIFALIIENEFIRIIFRFIGKNVAIYVSFKNENMLCRKFFSTHHEV